jgi:hypothetical protein
MQMRNSVLGCVVVALVAVNGMVQAARTWQDKAAEVLAAARKAIGAAKLEALDTFSADARVQRNVGTFQMSADLEVLLALPDKYARLETPSSGAMSMTMATGFNGERSLRQPNALSPSGGGMMVIRMGPGGQMPPSGEKLTPEQAEQANRKMVRSARHDISRLMLGWFATAHPSLKATYTYAGEAESPDGRAHVIDVKDDDGFSARLFIDEATNLPLMITYQGPKRIVMGGTRMAGGAVQHAPATAAGGDAKPQEADIQKRLDDLRSQPPALVEYHLYFSDWQTMGGIRFPRKIQRAVDGTTEEEWEVTRIELNPKIDARKFDVQG